MNPQQLAAKEKVIGGKTYQVRMLPTDLGLRSAAKLLNLIGPGVSALQSGSEDTFTRFVGELLTSERLADQLEYFTKLFRQYTAVEVEPGKMAELSTIYDVHFMGNYFELLQWLVFCFEANHASFLSGAGLNLEKVVGLIQAQLLSRYQNRAVTRGQSGASSSQDASTKPTSQ